MEFRPMRDRVRIGFLIVCISSLLGATLTILALQIGQFRRGFKNDLSALAEILGRSAAAPVAFENKAAATVVLDSLRAKRGVVGAFIVTETNELFASYGTINEATRRGPLKAVSEATAAEFDNMVLVSHPITQRDLPLGSITLVGDFSAISIQLIAVHALIMAGVLVVATAVIWIFSDRFGRRIAYPLERLAETVHDIADEGDYTVRAPVLAEDEVGQFSAAFNSMLDQVQSRDEKLRFEIAERARAEKQLQELHEQLMEASRQAGMAEVATGVLHNVGNILNSVNVSASLVAERLSGNRLEKLGRLAQMLQRPQQELATFLTETDKGRVLPGYLTDLARYLAEERRCANEELRLLTKNIEHIKEIVTKQQAYARMSGTPEMLGASALVEDALHLTRSDVLQYGIRIERRGEELGLFVKAEKHKVLQILVNLIRNAVKAIRDYEASDLRMIVAIEAGDGVVNLRVTDSGIGIAPENLTRIFSHGFTTRKDGHGFGLHSAALAARQMNGNLHVSSEGLGTGASFALELPAASAVIVQTGSSVFRGNATNRIGSDRELSHTGGR
jgi:signal transduction histidine kinase